MIFLGCIVVILIFVIGFLLLTICRLTSILTVYEMEIERLKMENEDYTKYNEDLFWSIKKLKGEIDNGE